MAELNVALIGLDSSHSIEFARRFQAPDCPESSKVGGIRVTKCLRFETRFQGAEGLAKGQKQLEAWGVNVTDSFEEAVCDADALMIEINDPALHLDYFDRAAGLGKPVFLDKPLADTVANGRRILDLAARQGTRWFSASSLRFAAELEEALAREQSPDVVSVYGPLGKAAAGSSVVWYGVHAFEMLERAMGRGAKTVTACPDSRGVVVSVRYEDDRRGVVELTEGAYIYGGILRSPDAGNPFVVDVSTIYSALLEKVAAFFRGAPAPVDPLDTLEIMALLEATNHAIETGQPQAVTC
jgi:predicted dehydrogenase